MKNLFPQFAIRKPDANVWKNSLIVFDANTLLNLYRYRPKTRGALLELIDGFHPRIWIPFQVAVEYQRNRPIVLGEQISRFNDVESTTTSARDRLLADLGKLQLETRHSLIDASELIADFNRIVDVFLKRLKELRQKQTTPTSDDPVKVELERLFDGHTGTPPSNQQELDALYKEAESRYSSKLPPGFEDDTKGKGEEDLYLCNGLLYKSRYGDFVLWRQLVSHVQQTGEKSIVFVTDDLKKDWWLKVRADGEFTIGPRPELTEEIFRAGATTFQMYSPKNFIERATEYFSNPVGEDVLSEVQSVSARPVRKLSLSEKTTIVWEWLRSRFGHVSITGKHPDFIVTHGGRRKAFELMFYDETPLAIVLDKFQNYLAAHQEPNTTLILVDERMIEPEEIVMEYFDLIDARPELRSSRLDIIRITDGAVERLIEA